VGSEKAASRGVSPPARKDIPLPAIARRDYNSEMNITLNNLPADVEQALFARAAAERRPVESVVLDAVVRELGVELPQSDDSNAEGESRKLSRVSGNSQCKPADTSVTTYTVNEYGAILVCPATTDAAGNPLPKRRDLSFLTQGPPLEPEVLQALEEQRQIDPDLWQ
jgi:plasmid stability protein